MEITHLAYALFLFAVILLYLQRRRRAASATPRTTAHCPHPNRLLGNTVEFLRNRRRLFDWYTDLLRAAPSGTIEAWGPLGAGHAVTTASPASVDHILRANFANYVKGPRMRVAMSELLGDGIFGADGRLWSLQRKVASYAFSSRSLGRFTDDVLAVHLRRDLLPSLDAAAESGEAVDLQDALRRFTFDTICHVAFGVEGSTVVGSSDPRHDALLAAFDTAVEISFMRMLTPSMGVRKLTRLLNVGKSRRLREAVDIIDDHAMSVIESKEAQRRDGREEGNPDLLARFMEALDEEDGGELSSMFSSPEAKRRLLRDVVVSFVLAGKDTASSALTWFFWLLAANPWCERRVHDEVSRGDGDVKAMRYLHAAITEAMRLYPPVALNARVAAADDVLPDGAAVRAGWFANYSAYAMGRMECLWGSDCLEFRPERWLGGDGGGKFVPVDAARYPVFHAGPRMCLGREMAYVQMKTVAAAVLRRFRVHVTAPAASMDAPPVYELTGTMKMKEGLWVQVTRRGD